MSDKLEVKQPKPPRGVSKRELTAFNIMLWRLAGLSFRDICLITGRSHMKIMKTVAQSGAVLPSDAEIDLWRYTTAQATADQMLARKATRSEAVRVGLPIEIVNERWPEPSSSPAVQATAWGLFDEGYEVAAVAAILTLPLGRVMVWRKAWRQNRLALAAEADDTETAGQPDGSGA